MNKIFYLTFFLFSLSFLNSKTVIEKPFSKNDSLKTILKTIDEISKKEFDNLDLNKLVEEDFLNDSDGLIKPFRFGITKEEKIELKSISTIERIKGFGTIYRLKLKCTNATCFNLSFDNSSNENIILNIFAKDEEINTFSRNIQKFSLFSSGIINGNEVVIEIFSKNENYETGLILKFVTLGYKEISEEILPSKNKTKLLSSSSCNRNVSCSEGDVYCKEKYSVAKVIIFGSSYSGSLINNVRMDYTPYFLTAFHCLDIGIGVDYQNGIISEDEKNMLAYSVFEFQYFLLGCSSGTQYKYTYYGSEFISAWVSTDFALIKLLEQPEPGESNQFLDVNYSGWDISGDTPNNVTALHHPAGDYMKISQRNSSPSTYSTYFWDVDWDSGTTEGGSSGCPLYDDNFKIIGQNLGQPPPFLAPCHPDKRTIFGKLSLSWEGGGTSTTRLKDWLDPDDTEVEVLDGIYTQNLSLGLNVNNGQTFHYYGHSDYVIGSSQIASFKVHSGGDFTLQAGREVVIKPCTYIKAGSEFRAFIQQPDCDVQIELSKKWSEHDPNVCSSYPKNVFAEFDEKPLILNSKLTLSPNPTSGNTIATVEIGEKSVCSLTLMDNLGNEVITIFKDKELAPGKYQYDLEANNLSNGVYLCVLRIGSSMHSEKLVYLK